LGGGGEEEERIHKSRIWKWKKVGLLLYFHVENIQPTFRILTMLLVSFAIVLVLFYKKILVFT